MTGIALAIDNDIVIKLAQMDVYEDALNAIGVTPDQVGSVTQMLKFLATAPHTQKLPLTPDEQDRLHNVVSTIADLGMTDAESRVAAAMSKAILQAGLDLQEGETALMAIATRRAGLEVATGDKRALRDLPGLAAVYPALKVLKGRLICLEQIFKNICKVHGFKRVRAAVLKAPHADKIIQQFYDHAATTKESQFTTGMTFVVQKQIKDVAPGWLKPL